MSVEVILEQHPTRGGSYAQDAYDELRADDISVRSANEAASPIPMKKPSTSTTGSAGIFTFNFSYSAFFFQS